MVFCLKGVMWLWSAPLWTACAKWCNKKKPVLGLSLFFLTASSLMLALVPPTTPGLPMEFCLQNRNYSETLSFPWSHHAESNVSDPDVSSSSPGVSSSSLSTVTSTTVTTTSTSVSTTTTMTTTPSTTTNSPPLDTNADNSKNVDIDYSENQDSDSGPKGLTEDQLREQLETLGLDKTVIQQFMSMTTDEQEIFLDQLMKQLDDSPPENPGYKSRHGRSVDYKNRVKRDLDNEPARNTTDDMSMLTKTVGNMMKRMGLTDKVPETFVFVLALVLVGEMFSSPVDKLADDVWFEYLDLADALDMYGSHRAWAALGMVVMAPVVTAIIDHLPCSLPHGMSSFMVHFFVFVGFMLITLLALCLYPVSKTKRTAKRSKLEKGLRVLCGDVHATAYTLTMFVVSVTFAPVLYFLMWQMQDLDGSELVMGMAIAAGALSQLLLYPLNGWLVKHISHAGAVCLALFILVARLAFYSVMWSPWLAVVGEATQGLTISLLWAAVHSYKDFKCNPHIMDRSAYSVINALYAFGTLVGAALAGVVYDYLGVRVLFRGCAVTVGVWLLVFMLLMLCTKRKEKVRYAALLQDDRDLSSDEDNTIYQDDWLEVALSKKNKS